MPVTIKPATHAASGVSGPRQRFHLSDMADRVFHRDAENWSILQSSYASLNVQAYDHGLVRAAIAAYSSHHNLIIRPDDVWTAILAQFSTYVNKHAEELRGKFVSHTGQKHLVLEYSASSRYDFEFGVFAKDMGNLLKDNVKDPTLRDWIIPKFTTTTRDDVVVASIAMMSTLQKYFTYECSLMCGIPSVTLLGEKEDWQNILGRLDKLEEFGNEPKAFAAALRAVVLRFVSSFDAPDSAETKQFWQLIADKTEGGSGPSYYSGWITAFCFWSAKGNMIRGTGLTLDGARFPTIDTENVPPGWTQVPVIVTDNGTRVDTVMIAGSLSIDVSRSAGIEDGERRPGRADTLQPAIGWIMFEKNNGQGPKRIKSSNRGALVGDDLFGARHDEDMSPWCGPSSGRGCWDPNNAFI